MEVLFLLSIFLLEFLQGGIDDGLAHRFLALADHHVHELRQQRAVIARIGINLAFVGFFSA